MRASIREEDGDKEEESRTTYETDQGWNVTESALCDWQKTSR